MKCESCKKEANSICQWGLYEPGAKIKEKFKKRNIKKDSDYYDCYGTIDLDDIYEPGWIKRVGSMNIANLCSDHSEELWLNIKGSVNAGFMHFKISKI